MQTQFTQLIFWLLFLFSFPSLASDTTAFSSTIESQSAVPKNDSAYGASKPDALTQTDTKSNDAAQEELDSLDQDTTFPVYKVTESADDQGRIIYDGFDDQDRLILTLFPDTTAEIYNYQDDGSYKVIQTAPSGQISEFGYDEQGELVFLSVPSISAAETFALPDTTVYGSPDPTSNFNDFVNQTYYISDSTSNTQVAALGPAIRIVTITKGLPSKVKKVINGIKYRLNKNGDWVKVPSVPTVYKAFNATNSRHNLMVLTKQTPPASTQAHHVFPQAKDIANFMEQKVKINIHDPKFLAWWDGKIHNAQSTAYNNEWRAWIQINKNDNNLLNGVLQKGREMAENYGFQINY